MGNVAIIAVSTLGAAIVLLVIDKLIDGEMLSLIAWILSFAEAILNTILLCMDGDILPSEVVGMAFLIYLPIVIVSFAAMRRIGCFAPLVMLLAVLVLPNILKVCINNKYDATFELKSEIVEVESYEVVAVYADIDDEGKVMPAFYWEGEIKNEVKFYYLDGDGEKTQHTLRDSEVVIEVKTGEPASWRVITTTQIWVSSKTGEVREEILVTNELQVPRKSLLVSTGG